MGGRALRAAVLLVAAMPGAAHAIPATGERATVDVTYTTTRPGEPSGLTYTSRIHGDEPPAVRRLIVGAPPGAVIDTSVPAQCKASDEELRARGDSACPPESLVGTGWAELLVVAFGRQRFEASAFNDDGQQFETVRQGNQVQAIVRGYFTDEGLDALIPTCITGGQPPSGCPDDQARLLASELVIPPRTEGGRAYFTTPPDCPSSGRWQSPIVLTYADGVTERLVTEQPCERPATTAPPRSDCRSRRRVVFTALARVGLRRIVARFRGRRIRLDPRRPTLDLRGLPRGRYKVRIIATTKRGTRVRFTRRYRTCTA